MIHFLPIEMCGCCYTSFAVAFSLGGRMKVVETVYCPTVDLPEDFQRHKKRKHFHHEGDGNTSNLDMNDRKMFAQMFSSVKEFGMTNLEKSKKKVLENKLTKLGAPPVKQPKMPFKMKMGILEGRKKREQRQLQDARDSGQVLATSLTSKKKNEREKLKKRALSDQQQPDLDVRTRRGVLRLEAPGGKSKRGRRR
jgi:hypothetical protein